MQPNISMDANQALARQWKKPSSHHNIKALLVGMVRK